MRWTKSDSVYLLYRATVTTGAGCLILRIALHFIIDINPRIIPEDILRPNIGADLHHDFTCHGLQPLGLQPNLTFPLVNEATPWCIVERLFMSFGTRRKGFHVTCDM